MEEEGRGKESKGRSRKEGGGKEEKGRRRDERVRRSKRKEEAGKSVIYVFKPLYKIVRTNQMTILRK